MECGGLLKVGTAIDVQAGTRQDLLSAKPEANDPVDPHVRRTAHLQLPDTTRKHLYPSTIQVQVYNVRGKYFHLSHAQSMHMLE